MWRLATGSPRSMRFASCTSCAAFSSLWRPTSARNSCSESAAPESDSLAQTAASAASFAFSSSLSVGRPTSRPIASSSRVICSASSVPSSFSVTKASSSAGSTQPRSSERSTIDFSCSVSKSSMSWFCVKPVCQSFRSLGGAQSSLTLCAILSFFHGIGTTNRVTIPQRAHRLPYSIRGSAPSPSAVNRTPDDARTPDGRARLEPYAAPRRVSAAAACPPSGLRGALCAALGEQLERALEGQLARRRRRGGGSHSSRRP